MVSDHLRWLGAVWACGFKPLARPGSKEAPLPDLARCSIHCSNMSETGLIEPHLSPAFLGYLAIPDPYPEFS